MPFPITCAACGKTFSITDDVYERKVKGRVVTIKCKQCQAGIRVDGTQATITATVGGEAAPSAPLASSEAATATPLPAAKPAPAPAPPPVAPEAAPAPTAASTAATPKPAPVSPTATPKPAAATATPAPAPTPAVTKAAAAPVAAPKAAAPTTAKVQPQPAAKAPAAAATPKLKLESARATLPFIPGSMGDLDATLPRAEANRLGARAEAPKAAAPKANLAAAPKIEPKPPATPSVPDVLWAVEFPDGQDRELTAQEMAAAFVAKTIASNTLVWREGMDEWLELGQVAELAWVTASPKAAPAPQRAKAPSAAGINVPGQRAKAPSAPALNLPAQRASSPSAPSLDTPRAQAPSAPSLDAARAKAPSAPSLDAARAKAPSAPAFELPKAEPKPEPVPFAIATPSAVPLGVQNPALMLSEPQAPTPAAFAATATPFPQRGSPIAPLLSSALPTPPSFAAPKVPQFVPAPAQAPQFAAPPAAFPASSPSNFGVPAAPHTGDDWPQAKGKKPLVIGLVVGVLALGGLGIFFASSSASDTPPAPQISALPPSVPTTHTDTPPTAETTSSPAAAADSPSPGSGAALRDPNAAPPTTPNAGFAEMFASGARHADEKRGVNGPTQRFDPAAAKTALAAAANQAAACRERGGPTGKATIVVTFDPSGKVSSATVSDAPFTGTSTGACIASAMKNATVPAFSGLPGTVTKTISIQ